ncbi:MAG TPA: helix-turn-helix domain-containing protein [Gemmatimonadales bacterium]|nr:helix-turn-helix domain-containing protein [Gemmatimonadales bacterium]
MSALPLTPAQRRRLEQQLRATQDAGLFRRTLAVLEATGGRPVAEVARLLRTSRPSVYQWLERFRCSRDPASLQDHRGGNHATLWTHELQALLAASLAEPPDHFGYPAVEWTAPLLREHLARCGGTRPSLRSVRRQLHQQGYVWKRPRYVLAPDPDAEKKTLASPRSGASVAALGPALRG